VGYVEVSGEINASPLEDRLCARTCSFEPYGIEAYDACSSIAVTIGSVPRLAETYIDVSRRLLALEAVGDTFVALTTLGAQVPGAEEAGITQVCNGKLATPVATGDLPPQTDAIQCERGTGPCVDAALKSGNSCGVRLL
jgi:hypothetical protein